MARITIITLIVVITMFSSVANAFSTHAKSVVRRAPNSVVKPPTFVRWMSVTKEGETTIVDVCKAKIMKALETDNVTVTGAYDDPNGSHISVTVVSDKFQGKRVVQRQQMVYKALWDELQGPVHAVDSMICKTPDEK
mmetsp:Transcript_15976/g.30128  ORF Transcript_15976/g.30128 Transcript_15976/m.30128 type:complete len:137 (+) Transcript_15976:87-497(+)